MNIKIKENIFDKNILANDEYLDLKKLFQKYENKNFKCLGICSMESVFDKIHLEYLSDYIQIKMFNAGKEHNIAN